MPKAEVKQSTKFILTLELNPNELDRLRTMMQNPLHGATLEQENEFDQSIRRAIFEACSRHRT
ncbi:hypothetical protein PP754_gp048 [Pectobacterium phage Possum]|uniref:Uncharacterized protein n=1 Tax=Pectobacterium phage Possum TaxID=2686301 RepID=A0A7T0LVP7_9CAUD|nr:hypothetical protein PP754_gp048 [Pectobacterium phage Possum]QPL10889.1 hypothetical protein Possum_00048 [Pectobacterium phage Possum]QPL10991.1 hypothetical protein Horatius_00048 [Pectobacterium phage Horatius]